MFKGGELENYCTSHITPKKLQDNPYRMRHLYKQKQMSWTEGIVLQS